MRKSLFLNILNLSAVIDITSAITVSKLDTATVTCTFDGLVDQTTIEWDGGLVTGGPASSTSSGVFTIDQGDYGSNEQTIELIIETATIEAYESSSDTITCQIQDDTSYFDTVDVTVLTPGNKSVRFLTFRTLKKKYFPLNKPIIILVIS